MKPQPQILEREDPQKEYAPFTVKFAFQLAAPHTWPAAILPVLFSVALASVTVEYLSVTLILTLLVICVLMQAAVNTLNDYFDFIKGADNLENQQDPTDAVLVYNNVNPRAAFNLALGFLIVGLLLGIYVIFRAGLIPLIIGFLGAAIIVVYSAGKSPLSYLPVGELVSGATMGGLIPLACYQALTGIFDWRVLLLSVPLILGIALIMFTNNTCDIEKDSEAGRKTLSVMLGRKNARKLYHYLLIFWITSIAVLLGFFFTKGLIVIPFMLLALYPLLKGLWSNPFTLQTRGQAMPLCLNVNIGLGTFYTGAILFSALTHLTF